jgi:hypothetical protein
MTGFASRSGSGRGVPGTRLGAAAERCVRERFLHDRHLAEWVELVAAEVLERDGAEVSPRTRLSSPARVDAGPVR